MKIHGCIGLPNSLREKEKDMKENKKSAVKQVLGCILILYAVFTAVPAAIYFFGDKVKTEETGAEAVSEIPEPSSEAENLPETEPPMDYGEESGADQPEQIPGFLDDFTLEGTAVQSLAVETTAAAKESFEIYDSSSGSILTVAVEDFLPAAVICEMPLSAPDEALKAQAVAAYTYYQWQAKSGTTEGADFTCDTGSWNVYVTDQQMQERWGEDFDENYSKIRAITDSVYGQMISDNGEVICSTYFAVSNGNTEASQNVWGGELSYLQTVASPGDKLSDGYLSTKLISGEEFGRQFSEVFPEKSFDFSKPKDEWIRDQQLSGAGYTSSVSIGGETLTGTEVRAALGLSSASFSVEYDGENFLFTVYG